MLSKIYLRKIENYCKSMLLNFAIEDNIILLDDEYHIVPSGNLIFDSDMRFLPEKNYKEDAWFFEFGGRFYTYRRGEDVKLNEVRNIGTAIQKIPTKSFLGIRSGYELMNGIGLYKDYIAKAKYLGIETLGICENKTMSGALVFQNECKEAGIKSILGMTIPIKGKEIYSIKVYAQDFQGWLNLMKFNTKINVMNEHYITYDFLDNNNDGLIIVADPKQMPFDNLPTHIHYYQLDPVRFLNEDKDKWFINNLDAYINSNIEPISITDAFYIEQRDYKTREALWIISKSFDEPTDNQYMKNKDQYASELIDLFEKGNTTWINLFKKAVANEADMIIKCNFIYDTDTRHLPKYKMSEDEANEYDNNEDLFIGLVTKGFKNKDLPNPQQYVDRLKEEIRVLKKGDVIDYFLVLNDIIKFAKSEKMLTGIGRGSAGGSLVSYLLGITQIDPIEFDLLFERFLNDGRMGNFEDRPQYNVTTEDGLEVKLIEGSLVRVVRDSKELVIFVNELQYGDDLIKY